MTEAFIAHVWQFKLFEWKQPLTLSNSPESIEIIKVGTLNRHAGPDFFNARVRIGTTIWAGNVEIHVRASDWLQHQHQHDTAYNNIILHVVYEADCLIKRIDGSPIPTLALKQRLLPNVYRNYLLLQNRQHFIACEQLIHRVDSFVVNNWIDRILIERLDGKTTVVKQLLQQSKNDWETTFYRYLLRALGTKINQIPFELLAQSLPLTLLGKHRNSLFQLEALVFGQAGFLSSNIIFNDLYVQQLQQEFAFLQQKYQLKPLGKHLWKFSRLRPANFPSIRLAQLAMLIYQSQALFSQILAATTLHEYEILLTVNTSKYWETHYVLDKLAKVERRKTIGKAMLKSLIVNAVVPVLFVYAQERAMPVYKTKALDLLKTLVAEKNTIISKWTTLGIEADNAYQSQALLELYKSYCKPKRCLACAIGNKLLRMQ